VIEIDQDHRERGGAPDRMGERRGETPRNSRALASPVRPSVVASCVLPVVPKRVGERNRRATGQGRRPRRGPVGEGSLEGVS